MKLGIFSVLTIVLMVLKLVGTITVSWWIVVSPVIVIGVLKIGAIAFLASTKIRVDTRRVSRRYK